MLDKPACVDILLFFFTVSTCVCVVGNFVIKASIFVFITCACTWLCCFKSANYSFPALKEMSTDQFRDLWFSSNYLYRHIACCTWCSMQTLYSFFEKLSHGRDFSLKASEWQSATWWALSKYSALVLVCKGLFCFIAKDLCSEYGRHPQAKHACLWYPLNSGGKKLMAGCREALHQVTEATPVYHNSDTRYGNLVLSCILVLSCGLWGFPDLFNYQKLTSDTLKFNPER